jgi:hypothetical protein
MASSNLVVGGVPIDTSHFDFSDHSSNVQSVRTANITLISLVALFVGLRLFVRTYIVRKIFMDDGTDQPAALLHLLTADMAPAVLILIASAFTIALAAVCLAGMSAVSHAERRMLTWIAITQGLGTHVWLLPIATVFETVKNCIQVSSALGNFHVGQTDCRSTSSFARCCMLAP